MIESAVSEAAEPAVADDITACVVLMGDEAEVIQEEVATLKRMIMAEKN